MTDQLNLFDPNAPLPVTSEVSTPVPAATPIETAGEPPADLLETPTDQPPAAPPPLPPEASGPASDIPSPADYAARRYLEYAMSVVTGRALAVGGRGQGAAGSRCSAEFSTPCTGWACTRARAMSNRRVSSVM